LQAAGSTWYTDEPGETESSERPDLRGSFVVTNQGYEIIQLTTNRRLELVDVTPSVARVIAGAGVERGLALVYSPHTTAGVTINEGADPDVRSDVARFLESLVPRGWGFDHSEGNSDAHVMTSLVGPSVTLIVESGRPVLGTWQHIYFCEFDGPRNRTLYVKLIQG
jgi:secondary thiamine-phosphate synthase enzyme